MRSDSGVEGSAKCVGCGRGKFRVWVYQDRNWEAYCTRCGLTWTPPPRKPKQDAEGSQAVGERRDVGADVVSEANETLRKAVAEFTERITRSYAATDRAIREAEYGDKKGE
jgi:hypothetical protein